SVDGISRRLTTAMTRRRAHTVAAAPRRTGPQKASRTASSECLQQAGAVLRRLFGHLPDEYLCVKDRGHRFSLVNRAFCRLHGCETEQGILGRTDYDFHPPLLARLYVELDRRVMETRQPLIAEVGLVRGADGLAQWYCGTKVPVRGANGQIIGV